MKGIKFLLLIIVSLLFQGCSHLENKMDSNVDYEVVASEKNLPINFSQVAFRREEVPHFNYLVMSPSNRKELEKMWNFYQLSENTPNVNLDQNKIFFIGVLESGSCPYDLGAVNLDSNRQELTIHLSEPGGACTDDATPRTFVLQLSKENTKEIKNVVIVQSNAETPVPIRNSID